MSIDTHHQITAKPWSYVILTLRGATWHVTSNLGGGETEDVLIDINHLSRLPFPFGPGKSFLYNIGGTNEYSESRGFYH